MLKGYGSHHEEAGVASLTEVIRCAAGQTSPTILGQINRVGAVVPIADETGDCVANYRRSATGVDVGASQFYRNSKPKPYYFVYTFITIGIANYKVGDVAFTSTTGYYWYHTRYFDNFNYTGQHVNNGTQEETNNVSARLYTDKLDLALIGSNLTDKEAVILAADTPNASPGTVNGQLSRSREITVQGTIRF